MNGTLVRAFLRQRFTSPMRLGLMFLITFFPLVGVAFMGTLAPLAGVAAPLALILAAGAIGQEVSSGTLQLLFVRPVTRPSFFVSRWLATTLAATAMMAILLVLGTLAMMAHGTHPDGLDLVRLLIESAASAAGYSAVLMMFSSLVGGLGDVGLYVGSAVLLQMVMAGATFERWDWLVRACNELSGALGPQLSFAWMVQHLPPSPFALASYASTVTLALAVGIARLNRRELSYASD